MQKEQANENETQNNNGNEGKGAEAIVLTDGGIRLAAFWSRVLSGCGFDGSFNPVHVMENVIPLVDSSFNYQIVDEAEWKHGKFLAAFYSPESNCIVLRSDVYEKALDGDGLSKITVTHEVTHCIQSIIMRFLRSLEVVDFKTELCRNDSDEMRRHESQTDCIMSLVLSPENLLENRSDEDIAMEYLVSPLMSFMCSSIKYAGKILLDTLNELQVKKSA